MNAYEIPNLRFSLPAGAAVARHRFVSVNSDSAGIQATASTAVIGASVNQTAIDQVLEIADGIVVVEAGGLVTAGVRVSANADGKAIAYVAAEGVTACGVAVTGGSAGSIIAVKIV